MQTDRLWRFLQRIWPSTIKSEFCSIVFRPTLQTRCSVGRLFNTLLKISLSVVLKYKNLWFGISAPGESRFPNGLAFPRLAKVISRKVWHFRAWRKSFPEGFGISAPGESHFPNGLTFPRLAKVVSRMVWHFRAWRKSFPEGFGISARGESRFPKGLRLLPRGGEYFPKGLKRERIIYS